ncbi:MAG: flavin monoamine oxidase family protein [Acidimicrobiales bacterium]
MSQLTAASDHGDRSEPLVTAFGPDFCFAFDDWLAHPAGLGTVPDDIAGTEVAVVGAGVAGVVAAYELMRMGLKPVVHEAARMGGRLRSQRFGGADDVIAELGGMRFPISSTALFHYIDLVGLDTAPFPNPLTPAAPTTVIDLAGVTHHARTLDDLPPLFREVADAWADALEEHAGLSALQAAMRGRDAPTVQRLWRGLVDVWDDRTFYDFVASSSSFSALSYRHREVFGQVGFGTGGWDSDFPNSMLEILRVVSCAFDEDQHLIVGGAEQLVRRLWDHQPDDLAHWPAGTSLSSLHSGAPRPGVARIRRWDDASFEVTDDNDVAARYPVVLCTTQSWLLTTDIDVEESLFSHALWMALDRTRYMQSSKTFVMVDRPFWNDIDPATGWPLMGMTLTDRNTRGTYLFDNGPDKPAVICLSYAWMSDAMKVLPKSAAERARLALDTLDKIYPDAAIRSHVIGEPITVSWEADPNFLGAFKGALPGHYRYNRRMYGHFVQRDLPDHERGIFLAGDDVSWTPGWAEGAVQTALNAVWGIAAHLGGATHPDNPGPGDVWDELAPPSLPD